MQNEITGGLECGGGFSHGKKRRIGAKVVQEGRGGSGSHQKQHNKRGEGGKEPFWAEVPTLTKKTSKKCSPGECAWQGEQEA
jgi:hypothetical protein